MALGVYGKHPAKGDFLEHGLPGGLRPVIEGWLDATLSEARASLGQDWDDAWATAPVLRFWLGEAIWGTVIAGVMAPTRDRVGRRFPLVVLALDSGLAPPPLAPDQDWYDRAGRHLAAMLRQADLSGPAAVVEGLEDPAATTAVDSADFWAVREGANLAGLWADLAATDHRRAATGRSYWWVAGTGPSAEAEVPAETDGGAATEGASPAAATMPPAITTTVSGTPAAAEAGADDTGNPAGFAVAEELAVESSDPGAETLPVGEADVPAATRPEEPATDPLDSASVWDTPLADDGFGAADDSPFSAPSDGLSLFAPPAPVAPGFTAATAGDETRAETAGLAAAEPSLRAPAPERAAFSQLWAGPGLPTGQVVAWLLRGFQQNG